MSVQDYLYSGSDPTMSDDFFFEEVPGKVVRSDTQPRDAVGSSFKQALVGMAVVAASALVPIHTHAADFTTNAGAPAEDGAEETAPEEFDFEQAMEDSWREAEALYEAEGFSAAQALDEAVASLSIWRPAVELEAVPEGDL